MHLWTLAFSDAVLEERHTAKRFRAAEAPFVALCGVVIAVGAMQVAASPRPVMFHAIRMVGVGLILLARIHFGQWEDQARACVQFGRMLISVFLVTWVLALLSWSLYQPTAVLDIGSFGIFAVLRLMVPVYLRYSAICSQHRLTFAAIWNLGLLAFPVNSQRSAGRPSACACAVPTCSASWSAT